MRLGRLWILAALCLAFCGIASADGLDPSIQLGGDPPIAVIKILTFPTFNFNITFPSTCTLGGNCSITDDFQNDTNHDLTSLTITYAGGGLSCGLLTGSPFANCSVSNNTKSVTFFGGDIPSAVCTDTDHDNDGGSKCNSDDTWTGGLFSMDFTGFPGGPNSFTGTENTVPEPASFGLMFSGLGALIAGYKKFSSRHAS